MRLLIVSLGRLITNGSAGTTVMCGLVEACLRRGHTVAHLALLPRGYVGNGEIKFKPDMGADRLTSADIHYVLRKPRGRINRYRTAFERWFVAAYDHSYGEKIVDTGGLLAEAFDGVVAFESLAVDLVKDLNCARKFFILGDPVGLRVWHSTMWTNVRRRVLAAAYSVAEQHHFRKRLPEGAAVGMFGTSHAQEWTTALRRPVVDLRPMFPAIKMNISTRPRGPVPEFAFGGTLASTASRTAFKFLEEELLPALRMTFASGFYIRLIGKPSEDMERLARDNREVSLVGWVPSFEEELSKIGIFIAPMRYPVGVRTRVCSALAAGCFCVCDESILRNLPELKYCKAVRAVRSAEGYAKALKEYFETPNNRKYYEEEAKRFFRENYDCGTAASPIISYLEGAVQVTSE